MADLLVGSKAVLWDVNLVVMKAGRMVDQMECRWADLRVGSSVGSKVFRLEDLMAGY